MIEPICIDDFDTLFEIEQQAHLVPWSKNILLDNQGERYCNLKLSQQGEIVAFAICQTILDEATLFNIAVRPQKQGKGYGKQLLCALIERLRTQGIQTLWLEVRQSNLAALHLYTSLGFNEVSQRKHYYPCPDGSRENAVMMALYL